MSGRDPSDAGRAPASDASSVNPFSRIRLLPTRRLIPERGGTRGRPGFRPGPVALCLGAIVFFSPSAPAQPVAPAAVPKPPTPAQQRQIQQMQEHLRKMTREQDDELERLVSELHGASRDKKIDLLTRIVTRLIEQRRAFHQESEAVRLRILDMRNPPAPLPRATDSPAPSLEKPASSPSEESPAPTPEQGQGYISPQQPQ